MLRPGKDVRPSQVPGVYTTWAGLQRAHRLGECGEWRVWVRDGEVQALNVLHRCLRSVLRVKSVAEESLLWNRMFSIFRVTVQGKERSP